MAILSFKGEQQGSPTERLDGQDWGQETFDPVVESTIELPSSKSLSNRYLILSALSGNETELVGLSSANDTQLLKDLLASINQEHDIIELDCQDAGTVWRFLLAYCSMQEGREFVLTGTERLRQRPIKPLVEALRMLGAEIEERKDGKLHVWGKSFTSTAVNLDAGISSQFITALMLIAPFTEKGITIQWEQEPVSSSYIRLTEQCLENFGVRFKQLENGIRMEAGYSIPKRIEVEKDWSSASYFIALAAKNRLALFFPGLNLKSEQGDAFSAVYFRYFGLSFYGTAHGVHVMPVDREWDIKPWTVNLLNCPDLAPALIAHASNFPNPSWFCGLETLSGKESDRIASLDGLIRFKGAKLEEVNHTLWQVSDTQSVRELSEIKTFSDHRIAMSTALILERGNQVQINDVQCVNKSFPEFWDELQKLGFELNTAPN